MKVSELVASMANFNYDAEVFVQTEDGLLHEFRIETRPAVFDGFDTVYDEGPSLIMTD